MAKENTEGMETRTGHKIAPVGGEILTAYEAGLICDVSVWAMYKRNKQGKAPGHYYGKRLFFLLHELLAYQE